MTENTKKLIVEQIVCLANSAVYGPKQIDQIMKNTVLITNRPYHLFSIEGVTFMLVDNAVNDYEKLLERLLQDEGWSEKFSEEYLGKAIQRTLALVLKTESSEVAGQYFDQLVTEFETFTQKYAVYIPLANIQMQADTFSMGNVIFRKMTDTYVSELIEKMISITMLTLSSSKVKEANNLWTKQRLEGWKGLICSEFSIVAEPHRARERAEEETRRVLDLLQYATPAIYQKGLNVVAGLEGEVMRSIRTTLIISLDLQSSELPSNLEGSICPFDLSPANIEKIEQIGVFKVAKVLQKSQQSDFERTLFRGIHWFAASQKQFERENELLNLMTCVETFLAPPDGRSVKNEVARGVALLLATEPEMRKVLKEKVRDLYRVRSEISHGGQQIVLEQHLVELRTIAINLIFQMIERKEEFTSQKSLISWLKNQ